MLQKTNKEETPKIKVRPTPPIKFKDKIGRQYVTINLKSLFGFQPEVIIVSKVAGQHDTMIVSAVLTEAEMKKEEKQKQKGFEIKDLPPKKV